MVCFDVLKYFLFFLFYNNNISYYYFSRAHTHAIINNNNIKKGDVFKAIWRGTVVAVKKLPAHNITPALLVDFVREVRLMKQLRHPNILMLLGATLTDNHRDLAIIMEFMPVRV